MDKTNKKQMVWYWYQQSWAGPRSKAPAKKKSLDWNCYQKKEWGFLMSAVWNPSFLLFSNWEADQPFPPKLMASKFHRENAASSRCLPYLLLFNKQKMKIWNPSKCFLSSLCKCQRVQGGLSLCLQSSSLSRPREEVSVQAHEVHLETLSSATSFPV